MRIKDLVKWFGEDAEVYSCVIEEDIINNIDEMGIDKNQKNYKEFYDEVVSRCRKVLGDYSHSDLIKDIINEKAEEFDIKKDDIYHYEE